MSKVIIVHYEEDTDAIAQYKMDSRYCWEDHISNTRTAINSIIAGLDDVEAISNRLVVNQGDIGKLIEPYYGSSACNMFANLLKSHILIAVDIVKTAKSSKPTETLQADWKINAQLIAEFLSSLDPYNWDKDSVTHCWLNHMECTLREITTRISKNWIANIGAYDDVHCGIVKIADMISSGIVNRYPEKFVK